MTSVLERDEFDGMLEEVLDSLPDEIFDLLDDVPLVVEDEPSRELLKDMGIQARPGEADLCGLHSGIPLTERGFFSSGELPGQICLFRGPILRLANWDPDETLKQIRITLLHELGHHFGWDEAYIHDLGYE
jgi:predicted Zn-dependent protease with MMP-like domain